MDQVSIVNQLNDCLDHHKVIKMQINWIGGKVEVILFEPYLLGENPVSNWTFIYGKVTKNSRPISVPVPCIVSVDETDDGFVVSEKDKCFLVLDCEKNRITKSIPEMQILDISEPDENEDEDDDLHRPECPFCSKEYDCEHLIFDFDLSFGECKGGYFKELDELRNIIERAFIELIEKKIELKYTKAYPPEAFFEIWSYAKETYNPKSKDFNFDNDNFMRLIEYILDNNISEVVKDHYGSGGAPGFDSAMVICYAENPVDIYKRAGEIIKGYIQFIQ